MARIDPTDTIELAPKKASEAIPMRSVCIAYWQAAESKSYSAAGLLKIWTADTDLDIRKAIERAENFGLIRDDKLTDKGQQLLEEPWREHGY